MNGLSNSAAGGTCNEEQVETCRDAALEDRLDSLASGGECIAKGYLEFSHVCTVTDYLPTVDYCCCHFRRQLVLCCRYHQDWNHFRCSESEDAVESRNITRNGGGVLTSQVHHTMGHMAYQHSQKCWYMNQLSVIGISILYLTGVLCGFIIISIPAINGSGYSIALRYPPLNVLLPSIFVPLVVIFCLAVVCVRCYRRHVRNEQRYLAASTSTRVNYRERFQTNKHTVSATTSATSDYTGGGFRCHDNDDTTTALTVDRTSVPDLFFAVDGEPVGDYNSTLEPTAPPEYLAPPLAHASSSCCRPGELPQCAQPPNYRLFGCTGYDARPEVFTKHQRSCRQVDAHNRLRHCPCSEHRCDHHHHHHHLPVASSTEMCGVIDSGCRCLNRPFNTQPPPPYSDAWDRT